MSHTPTSAGGLVRVTVASDSRRVDLVLPAAVPVAELLPELARSVGLLDAGSVYAGYRLVTHDGRVLAGDTGLLAQGVADGGLVTVAARVDDPPPRVYDDVVEAMADVVERDLRPWEPATGRRTALAGAAMLMTLAAVALLVQDSPLATVAASVVAVALVIGALVLSRAQGEAEAAVTVAWVGCAYAALAGFLLAPPTAAAVGVPTACAGAGALVAGLVCVSGLAETRSLAVPPVVVGAVLVVTGLVVEAGVVDPAILLTGTLAFVVLVGSLLPWLALGATGTTVDQLYSTADITSEPREVDPDRVGADARVAHELLLAGSVTVGLFLVLIAPLAVSRGVSGALLVVMCCLVVMLRTRQYRTGTEVVTGLVSGVLGLASVAGSALWLHPTWRPEAAVVLAASGALLLTLTLVPSTPSVRRGRLGDIAEGIAMLSLLPLLVLATGVLAAVQG